MSIFFPLHIHFFHLDTISRAKVEKKDALVCPKVEIKDIQPAWRWKKKIPSGETTKLSAAISVSYRGRVWVAGLIF